MGGKARAPRAMKPLSAVPLPSHRLEAAERVVVGGGDGTSSPRPPRGGSATAASSKALWASPLNEAAPPGADAAEGAAAGGVGILANWTPRGTEAMGERAGGAHTSGSDVPLSPGGKASMASRIAHRRLHRAVA